MKTFEARKNRFQLKCIHAAVLLLAAQAAAAQSVPQAPETPQPGTSEAGPATLERIIVTARKRPESVQDIPASVKVFSARTLEDAGVTQIQDFIGLTPNASIVNSQSAGISFITIRGLSQVRNGEPPVAMVVDGIQVPNSKSFTQELFDLSNVQVLRGPQGAVYGRNAPGGAILITTKAPTNERTGFVQGGVGSGDEKAVKGALSGALVDDTLYYRVGGSYIDRAGYFENINLGRKQDPLTDTTGHALLRWTPDADTTVDLRANASHTTGGANNFVAQTIKYDPANRCQLDPVNPFGGPPPDPNRVTNVFCSSYIGHNDRTVNDLSLKMDKELAIGTLTGILGYNRVKEFESGTQFPYTATPNLFGFLNGTQTQYTDDSGRSLELRLASPSKQSLRWMGGVYFLRSTGFISTTTGSDTGTGIFELTREPRFGAAVNPTLSWLADTKHDSTRSIFGNVAYDILPNLEASAGFRYDRNARTQDVDPRQASAPGAPAVPAGCTASTTDLCTNRANFSAMQPTAALRYKVNEDVQVYTTVGRGFRAGQFNQSGAAAAAAGTGVVGVKDLVGSEFTTSVEAGVKMEFDNRTRIEAAVFRSVVKGQQYFLFIPSISAQVLANIDKVTLTGGEVEVAHTPMKGLDLYAGLGLTHSRVDAYQLNPAAVGSWAPYVPRMSFNLGAQYRFPITAGLTGMTRVDFVEKGKQYWDPENSAPRSSIALVNLRFGIEDARRKWSVLGSVVNATNRRYNEEFVAGGFATIAAPRVWRLDLRYNL